MLFYLRICHFTGSTPFFAILDFHHFTAVAVKEFGQFIAVHPYLVIPFLLRLVEDQLQPPMKMYHFNIVDILLGAVTGMSHVTDHIPCGDYTTLLKSFRIRIILTKMRIVIIPLTVKTADADTPAAILVPTEGLHNAGFDTDDRRTDLSHHVMSQMRSGISVTSGGSEIIIMAVIKSFCNR